MDYNIAIDADSLVYKSCHRHMTENKQDIDIELAYLEFCGEISKICAQVFTQRCRHCQDIHSGIVEYEKGDRVIPLIILSPRKSFRNDISPSGVRFTEITRGINKGDLRDLGYKANRKPNTVPGITDLKRLILARLNSIMITENLLPDGSKAEADDIVNYYARVKGYLISAIDKDVINANPTYSFDYNKREWQLPRTPEQVEQWYLVQTLMGDSTDNVAGAKGIGEKGARDIIYGQHNGEATYEDIIEYFDSELDCMLNHTLVRMDGYDGSKIIPWEG